ncbi:DgyrCDS1150 [Dimorphilus gyrociliatus]|uniref:non-specific serine/threonine protein kinase n=1 Tax=Dimorphilus gyrociliatus TaxID=2664684 RepID=A0A7I8V9J3_9ANNE|nr:DgyrCDS1150 [Dimorphilus gyrociliatus]
MDKENDTERPINVHLSSTEDEQLLHTSGDIGNYFQDEGGSLNFFTRVDSAEIIYHERPKKAKIIGNYLIGHVLGEGSYGKVKECLDTESLSRRAVKILKQRQLKRIPNGVSNVKREIILLKKLHNKHVIKLFDVFVSEEKQKIYLFMEYCVGSLQSMLDNVESKCFPLWQAHLYFVQLIDGVDYLHSRGIVHKDIKPPNLLLSLDETLKITDLGVAEELDMYSKVDCCSLSQGSPAFQAPEIADGAEYFSAFKADVWSCGVTLFNITTGKLPFMADNIYKLFECIVKCEYTIPELDSPHCTDCIKGMLKKDSTERFSIKDIKSHEWYRRKLGRSKEYVPPPPYNKDDMLRRMSVIPNLEILYMEESAESETEVELQHVEDYKKASRQHSNDNKKKGSSVKNFSGSFCKLS